MKDEDKYIEALAFYAGTDNHYGAGYDADGKISTLDWNANNLKPAPTIAQLDAIISSTAYSHKRALEYPTIADQLDALWKGGDDAAAMKAIVDKVKSDNPK